MFGLTWSSTAKRSQLWPSLCVHHNSTLPTPLGPTRVSSYSRLISLALMYWSGGISLRAGAPIGAGASELATSRVFGSMYGVCWTYGVCCTDGVCGTELAIGGGPTRSAGGGRGGVAVGG